MRAGGRRKKQDRKVTAFGNQSGCFLLTCLFEVEPFRKKNIFFKKKKKNLEGCVIWAF